MSAMGYKVTTYYRDGDTWDDGSWDDEWDAIDAARAIAEKSNPEIVAMVSVLNESREVFRTTGIGTFEETP